MIARANVVGCATVTIPEGGFKARVVLPAGALLRYLGINWRNQCQENTLSPNATNAPKSGKRVDSTSRMASVKELELSSEG